MDELLINASYELSKNIYERKVNQKEAIKNFVTEYKVNKNSIIDIIYIFQKMMTGSRYTRTLNFDRTQIFLEKIKRDYGIEGLKKAITSVLKHIEYYETVQSSEMKKIRGLMHNYIEYIENDIVSNNENSQLLLSEGKQNLIEVNVYERNIKARAICIEHYGYKCQVCGFQFSKKYKNIGECFIHVHHIKPLSEIKGEYIVDPIQDLVPVCANCHAMIHQRKPAYTINEVKQKII
jgi:5-methylcytosine-specific restriction protein A